MLDQETKKKINDLRDTLVGKVPDPKSQVEQIMIALIYKFMNDMDKESTDLGGEASFFVGDFEKYSWNNLFGTKVSGNELVDLYSTAVESMEENPNIPQLFRDIFKNAYIPYKDAETLRLFLSQIDDFEYSKDSEQLGDAFEHILKSLSSQGDAGQFRTPRHIIDFIVEIVDPKKDETILDPASGTSGFLISAFKHIVNSNSEKSSGDLLSAAERKKIMENINGYDISPDMVRIGLANMYLHGFPEPNVAEYDALTSEDRWNEYYDVILANPPFMTPRGGIRPHNKFGLKSNRAEVLFVDYILTHLKPKGRAGIIVPEGIIFQSGLAYKALRKKLVEDGLIGIISMPAGIFNPYSGVKTSILLIDKSNKSDSMFFCEIKNDGYSLNAQRTPINLNDLPSALQEIQQFSASKLVESKTSFFWSVKKSEILSDPIHLFTPQKYKPGNQIKSKFDIVTLESVCNSIEDGDWVESKDQSDSGIRLVQTGNIGLGRYLDKPDRARFISDETFKRLKCRELKSSDILVSRLPDPVGRACKVPNLETKLITSVDVAILDFDTTKIFPDYFLYLSQSQYYQTEIDKYLTGASRQRISKNNLKKIQLPLPPLEKQKEILDEIEQYEKQIHKAEQAIVDSNKKIEEAVLKIYKE